LSVSERHVKNLVYSGALLSITVGRLRRIYIGDLRAYIDERREITAHDAASRTGGHEAVWSSIAVNWQSFFFAPPIGATNFKSTRTR